MKEFAQLGAFSSHLKINPIAKRNKTKNGLIASPCKEFHHLKIKPSFVQFGFYFVPTIKAKLIKLELETTSL